MADELNTPSHRWYQRRYNIPLANEDFSKQWIFDSGIQKIDAYIALLGGVSPLSIYAVEGFDPALVFDFGEDYFRTSGSVSTFSDAITHSRAGNATMVDSDGLLKWAPHNLLTYSEAPANWANQGSTDAELTDGLPTGISRGWKLVEDTSTNQHNMSVGGSATVVGGTYRYSGWVKAAERSVVWFYSTSAARGIYFDLSSVTASSAFGGGSATTSGVISDAGNGWYFCELIVEGVTGTSGQMIIGVTTAAGTISYAGDGSSGAYFAGFHLYRSDLGGMVNNPDRGDSYVPTTSSAVYLPRRGHHVYNGSAWVNEGLLHESEARTNLFDGSTTPATSWGNFANASLVADSAVSPDGNTNATLIQGSSAGGTGVVAVENNLVLSSLVNNTYSVFLKANGASWAAIYGGNFTTNPGLTYFNLSTGAVGTIGSNVTGTHIEDFGSGWWRVGVTFNPGADNVGSLRVLVTDADNAVTTALDGTATIYMYGPQVEAGSTPSSYIPTSGATVTRPAETLTVPAANLPWPSPVVIGEELVTDSDFDDSLAWAVSGASVSGGNAIFSSAPNNAFVRDTDGAPVVSGKVYEVSVLVSSYTTGNLKIRIGGTPGYEGVLNPTGPGVYKAVVGVGNTGADTWLIAIGTTTATIDNISVKEINPLSVSIQMDGKMVYADEGVSFNNTFWRWYINSGDKIEAYLSTLSADTGNVIWDQRDPVSGADLVSSGATTYSPGVNVPFNIASRHGSTFINGAIDGTALTANTTPVALPDLSATDLQLGYDMMGTIGKLRIWADDLGDTGIAEATLPSLEPSLSLTFDGSETSFTVLDWSA